MTDEILTPLGRLLEAARGPLSKREAARRAGISEGRWRQIVSGQQKAGGGIIVPANPRRDTVVAMAQAVDADEAEALALAGFPAEPTHLRQARPGVDVRAAVRADPDLLDEAKRHLLNQYELLLRVSPPKPSEQRGKQIPRRATTQPVARLEAVAEGGDPAHRAEMERRAREARVRHPRKRTEESHGDGR